MLLICILSECILKLIHVRFWFAFRIKISLREIKCQNVTLVPKHPFLVWFPLYFIESVFLFATLKQRSTTWKTLTWEDDSRNTNFHNISQLKQHDSFFAGRRQRFRLCSYTMRFSFSQYNNESVFLRVHLNVKLVLLLVSHYLDLCRFMWLHFEISS